MDRTDELWDYIVERDIATVEELKLVICINGYSEKTLNDILFARTSYRNIEQMKEAEK